MSVVFALPQTPVRETEAGIPYSSILMMALANRRISSGVSVTPESEDTGSGEETVVLEIVPPEE